MGLFTKRADEKRRTEARQGVKFDHASWHSGGEYPEDLDDEAAATHIGMFLAWLLLAGHVGGELSQDEVALLRTRAVTPGQFLLRYCDGKFVSTELDEAGIDFALAYYQGRNVRLPFADDYVAAVGFTMGDVYRIPDSWATFDAVAPVITTRYEEWNAQGRPIYLT